MGNGGSRHRLVGRSGFVDHGHHAAFDRKVFLDLNGYDERIAYNEDAEFDVRLVRAGKKIYLEGAAAIQYYPRARLTSLARQYHNFGWGTANTLLRQRNRPKVRRVLPVLLVLGCLLSLVFAAVDVRWLALPSHYVLLAAGWGTGLAIAQRDFCLLMSGPAAIVMHLTWGIGFLRRMLLGDRKKDARE